MSGNCVAGTVGVATHRRPNSSSGGSELFGDGPIRPHRTFGDCGYYIVNLLLEGGKARLIIVVVVVKSCHHVMVVVVLVLMLMLLDVLVFGCKCHP
jgi:hypothetical protein